MPEEPDINDLRDKLRRRKKDKKEPQESRLLGPEESTGSDETQEEKIDASNEPGKSPVDETSEINETSSEDVVDESVPIENHYDYDEKNEASEKNKEKSGFKLPKVKITPFRLLILAAVLGMTMLGVLVWYVFSDMSDVKEITYSGNQVITDEELSGRLQFEPGDKMFSINTGRAEENIELLPVIVDVTVERDWWNSVKVTVNEYDIIAYIENEGLLNPVMNNARVLRGYPVSPSDGPILYHFEGEEFENVVEEMQNIDPDILSRISEIQFSPSDQSQTRIHIFMNDGQEIVADYRDFGEKMNHYVGMKREIGEDSAGIIDIEVGSSFLPYGSSEADDIKQGIYDEPVQAEYIDNINSSLTAVKDSLNQLGQEGISDTDNEADEESDDTDSDSSE